MMLVDVAFIEGRERVDMVGSLHRIECVCIIRRDINVTTPTIADFRRVQCVIEHCLTISN